MVGIGLAAIGIVVGAMAAYLAVAPQRSVKRLGSIERFRRTRGHMKRRIGDLYERTLFEQQRYRSDKELPILTCNHWIPREPLPLDEVQLLMDAADPGDLRLARSKVRRHLPVGNDGKQAETYSDVVYLYDRPQVWFDSCAYRLMAVTPTVGPRQPGEPSITLTFSTARYFDGQDTAEYLGHEVADRDMSGKARLTDGKYRKWLSEPFSFERRAALPGVSTLTIRRSDQRAFFFMHRRDPEKVAVAMNATNVTPAGEFQPHDDVLPVWRTDLNIWNNMMREYAEEFLGRAESMGRGGSVVDYQHQEPYRSFVKALRDGNITIRFLGIGLDPLTWKPEICVVCIWKDSVFDRIFSDMVQVNEEGVLVVGKRAKHGYQGLEFTAANVQEYAAAPTTYPPGRVCLTLAWRWRQLLDIPAAG